MRQRDLVLVRSPSAGVDFRLVFVEKALDKVDSFLIDGGPFVSLHHDGSICKNGFSKSGKSSSILGIVYRGWGSPREVGSIIV